jgi:MFS family permease
MWSDPLIRGLMMILLVPSFLGQPYTSLIPVFAKDVLHVGPQGQGMLLTAAGLGALVGAISVATLGNTGRQGLIMLFGALIFGCSIIAFALTPWFGLALVFMGINGLCGVTYGTQATTILQTHTPRELRGRVMGVYMMNRGMVPLGSLMAGALAQVLGAPTTVVIMGSGCAALALWALISVPRVRQAGALSEEVVHGAGGPTRPMNTPSTSGNA